MKPAQLAAKLKELGSKSLLRLHTRFEEAAIDGYVLDVGPSFLMLLVIGDGIRFNGFECFRIADITKIEANPYADFCEAALKKRGQRRPRKPRIDLTSVSTLVQTAGEAFPLITLHFDATESGICYIGRFLAVNPTQVAMRLIDPGAVWHDEPEVYRLRAITRVGFAGGYEQALFLVGGKGPA